MLMVWVFWFFCFVFFAYEKVIDMHPKVFSAQSLEKE